MHKKQIKYIEQCKHRVCNDLRALVEAKMSSFYNLWAQQQPILKIRDDVLDNKLCAGYWNLHAESAFLAHSFLMDQLLVEHNEKFFYLTPQNLHIRNSVWVSSIMYRLGLQDFSYMGQPVVICDAAGKLRMAAGNSSFSSSSSEVRDGVPVNTKIPSAGLDLIRAVLDFFRTSFLHYLKGHTQTDDSQKFVQLKRFTEAGLQVGFILFVGNRIEKMPDNELASDCVMPEGPPEKAENLNALLSAIPRDDDHMIEHWTTVDPNRTNVREKAVQKLLQGFSLYVVLMGKNNPFENKIEARWRDTLIVCTVMASSGPPDIDGMLYLSTRNSLLSGGGRHHVTRDPVEILENKMEKDVSRKGVVRGNKVLYSNVVCVTDIFA